MSAKITKFAQICMSFKIRLYYDKTNQCDIWLIFEQSELTLEVSETRME